VVERGRTDADGRFRLDLTAADRHPDLRRTLVAAADGFGCDWAELPREPGAELTLRLVKDGPVRGRGPTTEGKPVGGRTGGVRALMTSPEGRLDEFLTATKQDPRLTPQRLTKQVYLLPAPLDRPGTTGPDGRFELRGVGAERLAQLEVRG